MAHSRLLVVAALLGLQAGASADETPAPTAVISTITLSPTAYAPPNIEDDRDWTDDVGRCTHRAENAVLFPFVFLALGALTMYLTSRYAPDVPYTVIMLCEGFLVDWWASLSNSCPLNAMQDSLYQWSHIDGNLLLLVFLPALLFGDSISMNAYQFFRAKWQCLLLAGPGVVFDTGIRVAMPGGRAEHQKNSARSRAHRRHGCRGLARPRRTTRARRRARPSRGPHAGGCRRG